MKINELRMDFSIMPDRVVVSIWGVCHTASDCEQLVAWLQLARSNMMEWEKIRADAARQAKAAASQNETSQPRKVQGAPPEHVGTDGISANIAVQGAMK